MATDITLPAVRGPALLYVGCERGDGTSTVNRLDLQAVEDPRERALCRALLAHALAELDRTEPLTQAAAEVRETALDERVRAVVRAELAKPQIVEREPTAIPCPGHEDCERCDVTDPCPCCGLRYIDGRWYRPRSQQDTSSPASGTWAVCRHCGLDITYGPYPADPRQPVLWWHPPGQRTCNVKPGPWGEWPTAAPVPAGEAA